MVGSCEVAGDWEPFLELFIGMELGAVVEGDGFEEFRFSGDNPSEYAVGFPSGPMSDFAQSGQASFSFNKREHAFEVVTAHDRVGLPMAKLGTVLGARGPLIDCSFSFESASIIHASVTLSAVFWVDSEFLVESAASSPVPFDHSVDRGNTDRELVLDLKDLANLVWAPLFSKKGFYALPLGHRELRTAVTPVIACCGVGVGNRGGVEARRPEVPPNFPVDCARMTPQELGNPRD